MDLYQKALNAKRYKREEERLKKRTTKSIEEELEVVKRKDDELKERIGTRSKEINSSLLNERFRTLVRAYRLMSHLQKRPKVYLV